MYRLTRLTCARSSRVAILTAIAATLILAATTSINVAQAAVIPIPLPAQRVTAHASIDANLQVGISTSRSRPPAPTPTAAPAAPSPAAPFPLGTYQVDPFHTITLRADNSALIAAHQLCFQQSNCPATTFAGAWSFSPDSQQLRVATTSPIVSAMRWLIITPTALSPSSASGILKMKVVPGSEEGDFPIEPRLNEKVITSVGRSSLRAMGRANVDGHETNEDDLKEGEEPWMYIEGL